MALLSQPIRQFAADDTSYEANKAREFWKNQQKFQPAAQPSAAPAPKTGAATSADFSVLRNVKNPALETQQTSLLKDFEKSKKENETLFQKYLEDAKNEAVRARADLERERAAYDNTKFREDLAKARADQEAAIRNTQGAALDFAAGNVERRLLGSTLPTGMSSQLQRAAVDEFSRATLPYEERLAAGRREDLGLLRDLDLRTAPLARRAGTEYLSTLLTPLQARTSLLNANIGTVAALGDVDRANTFYGLSTPYDNTRVPSLPVPASTYRVPSIPAYAPPRSGYTPLPESSSPFRFTQAPARGERTVQPQYPQFAEEDAYTARLRTPAQNEELRVGRLQAQAQADARAAADALYIAQTGSDPNSDPYYNEELWRKFYNESLGI